MIAALTAVGPWLGAGLKGRPVRPLGPDALGYLAAVLALTSEELSTAMRRRWGVSARELAEDALAEALRRAGGAADPTRPRLAGAGRPIGRWRRMSVMDEVSESGRRAVVRGGA